MRRLIDLSPEIARAIRDDTERQNNHPDVIKSEHLASKAVLEATGLPPSNKYAEGYPGHREYEGCAFAVEAGKLALERGPRPSFRLGI